MDDYLLMTQGFDTTSQSHISLYMMYLCHALDKSQRCIVSTIDQNQRWPLLHSKVYQRLGKDAFTTFDPGQRYGSKQTFCAMEAQ